MHDRPDIQGIVAAEAPVAVVFRAGPADRWRVFRWDLATHGVEDGAAFEGALFPSISAVSPDGRLLAYFATTRQRGDWARFFAVSKVPWLTALVAWRWPERRGFPSGAAFMGNRLVYTGIEAGPPFSGRAAGLHDFGAVKERGGPPAPEDVAVAAAALPQRHPERAVRVYARGEQRLLDVRDGVKGAADLRRYVLDGRVLERAQWAGFGPDGSVLVATTDGRLQVRDAGGAAVREVADLSDPGPSKVKSPDWARRW